MKFKHSLLALSITALSSGLIGCGGGGSDSSNTTTPPPATPTNSAPTAIAIDNANVDENTAGAVIGSLSVTDPDSGDTHTLSVAGDMFVLDGATLRLADGVMLQADGADAVTTIQAEVTATDSGNESYTTTLDISVNDIMDRFTFASAINAGESSVSYTGQIARHVLIAELNNYINTQLQSDLDTGVLTTRDAVIEKLNTYFRTSELAYPDMPVTFLANAEQALISNISSSHKDLVGKIAGNDASGQHKDWLNGDFAGWGATGSTTPEALVDTLFGMLADNAEAHLNGTVRQDFNGNDITKVYVHDNGVDLKQMIQKFLLMSVAYSQGTDDYFGVDTEGKGLLTDNISAQSAGRAYTNLEHQFDEGVGYFGAAQNYLEYNDNELAGSVTSDADGRADWNGFHDTDANGSIDLTAGYNWGQSVNAAKRDRGTVGNAMPTDYTKQAMEAFIAGRKVINDNVGQALTDEQMTMLETYVETGVDAWERAIVATVVHYINDTYADLGNIGTEDFNYEDLAKHFAEMKGFALGIQFNERTQLSDADFASLHDLMGTAPVITGDVASYRAGLLQARAILQTAYGFDADNVANW